MSNYETFDSLYIANLFTQNGDPRTALGYADAFINNVRDNKDVWDLRKLSEPQQNFFFMTILRIVANMSDKDKSSSVDYIGKQHWRRLLSDTLFQSFYINSKKWQDTSKDFNFLMGVAYLRFAEKEYDIKSSLNYLETADGLAKTRGEMENDRWYLGFTNLFLRNEELAAQLFATNRVLDVYTSRDNIRQYLCNPYLLQEMFVNFDFDLFRTIWARFGKESFEDAVRRAFDEAYLLRNFASVPGFESAEKRIEFVRQAEGVRSKLIELIKRNDVASLKGMLKLRPAVDMNNDDLVNVSKAKLLETQIHDISVITAYTGEPTVHVTVDFRVEGSSKEEIGTPCTPHTLSSSRKYWYFTRKLSSAQENWEIESVPEIRWTWKGGTPAPVPADLPSHRGKAGGLPAFIPAPPP